MSTRNARDTSGSGGSGTEASRRWNDRIDASLGNGASLRSASSRNRHHLILHRIILLLRIVLLLLKHLSPYLLLLGRK